MGKDLDNLGQILALLIYYAEDEDIFRLLKYYLPYLPIASVTRNGRTPKEYLLEKLCEPQYNIFESIRKDDLKQIKKYIHTSRLDILIYHLRMLDKCYFSNFLFVTHEEVKDDSLRCMAEKRILAATKGKSSDKHGLKRLLTEGNISKDEIPKILHILIDNYYKYGFYYLIEGDILTKIKIIYKKGFCSYEETKYKIKLLARKTNFINQETQHRIQIEKPIRQFFINEKNEMDMLAISFNTFKKINTAICEGLSKDIPTEPCAWCNPKKNRQNPRQLCDNCTFLLEKIRLLQSQERINRFDINQEINKYSWENTKTLNGLRKRRKEHLIEMLGGFSGIHKSLKNELSDMIEKSFRSIID